MIATDCMVVPAALRELEEQRLALAQQQEAFASQMSEAQRAAHLAAQQQYQEYQRALAQQQQQQQQQRRAASEEDLERERALRQAMLIQQDAMARAQAEARAEAEAAAERQRQSGVLGWMQGIAGGSGSGGGGSTARARGDGGSVRGGGVGDEGDLSSILQTGLSRFSNPTSKTDVFERACYAWQVIASDCLEF